MKWSEAIAKTAAYLEGKGVPDARVASELLAARLLRVGRGFLASHFDEEVREVQVEAMRRGMARLVRGEPLQYVLGEWDFRLLTLACDRRALIPRPETEELVTRVLDWLKARKKAEGRGDFVVIDVGTGTGAIALSLACEFPDGHYIATDVSEDALALARENAERCGLASRVQFAVADGLDDFDEPACLDVLVSNPPYIASSACATLDPRVRDFEPRMALDGGVRGLDFFDRYLGDAINLLKPNGAVFFEIGEDQGPALRDLMFEYGFDDIRIEKDFAGHDRYACARLP